MIGESNYKTGLVPVPKTGKKTNPNHSPEEIIAIENACRYKVDYIYFRRFEKRPSVAQVYLYDFTNNKTIDEEGLTNLHAQLYSSGQVPMFFVFTKKDVRIFNCFERPAEGKNFNMSVNGRF